MCGRPNVRAKRRRRTSNVRLPLELGSDRRQTSATCVSDDLQLSIFRRREKKSKTIWFRKSVFHRFRQIFEELDDFWHQNLIRWGILRFGWSNFQVCTTLGALFFLIRGPLPNTPAHLVKPEHGSWIFKKYLCILKRLCSWTQIFGSINTDFWFNQHRCVY